LNDQRLRDLARDLGAAWSNAVAIPAPTTLDESLTTEDAYSIQEHMIAARVDRGRRIAGWKLGLTSAPPPTTPIVGTLLDDMIIPTGSDLVLSSMVDPMVEAEIVIRIGATIDSVRSIEELENGPHEIGPGLEVIDYRTVDSAGVVDWIADNSTVAYAVVGEFVPISAVDPAGIEASLFGGGRHLATGVGEVVMGNPLAAVAWLSQHLVDRGQRLQQGDVILTGSLTGHHRVNPSDTMDFSADFSELGSVSVSFLA
jgi:2-keto-4-pentenoate hydratase